MSARFVLNTLGATVPSVRQFLRLISLIASQVSGTGIFHSVSAQMASE
jgi:hypothetical protein